MRIACMGVAAFALLSLSVQSGPLFAQTLEGNSGWVTEKCSRYREAYAAALKRVDAKAVSPAFLEAHQLFIDSNCTARADVCPKAPEEFRLANMLVLMGMNAGMSATFFPFACRKPGE